MITSRRWLWLLAILLGLSGGLNLFLLTRRPHTAAPAPRASLGTRAAPGPGPPFGVLVPNLGGQRGWTFPPPPDTDGGALPRRVDPSTDQAALCWIAEVEARLAWVFLGDHVRRLLGDLLADPNQQAQHAVERAQKIQELLGLTDREAQDFGDAYSPLRQRRVAEIRYGLDRDPPDWGAVFDSAHQFYRDEQRLLERRFGAARAATLNEAERVERLVLLSALASLADRPWDETLGR
jgi:hypothetical protein